MWRLCKHLIVVNNVPSLALIDSGNLWHTIISEKMMNKLQIAKDELRPLSITSLSTAKEGVTLQVLGKTKKDVKLMIGNCHKPFYLRPVVIKGLAMDVNLSLPFLTANKIDQLHSRGALLVRGREVCLRDHQSRPAESNCSPISHSFVYTSAAGKVPAYSWGKFPSPSPP